MRQFVGPSLLLLARPAIIRPLPRLLGLLVIVSPLGRIDRLRGILHFSLLFLRETMSAGHAARGALHHVAAAALDPADYHILGVLLLLGGLRWPRGQFRSMLSIYVRRGLILYLRHGLLGLGVKKLPHDDLALVPRNVIHVTLAAVFEKVGGAARAGLANC